MRAGQALVLEVYEALRRSPGWEDTLLVIVYDEHGGFYDHVAPPALEVDGRLGLRDLRGARAGAAGRPAGAKRQVCHELFDHTSLIKTILTRFAVNPEQAITSMGARVQHARHLGVALGDAPRTDIPDNEAARRAIAAWRVEAHSQRRGSAEAGPSPSPDGAGHKMALHEFQEEFVRFALLMRKMGLKHGEP